MFEEPKNIVLSKSFGPTSTTDNTLTTIGSSYQFPGQGFTVKKIRLAYGEITATIEVAGHLIIIVPGQKGSPFVYAFGNGGGGAANDRAQTKAEEILCNIPIPPNVTVTVKALTAEEVAEVTVSLMCEPGGNAGREEMTISVGGTGQDPTADTALTLTQNALLTNIGACGLTPYRDGIIRKIRAAAGNLVDSKASSGIISLTISGYPYPLEFAIGKGNGGDTSGVPGETDEITGLNLPIKANSALVVSVTMAEGTVSATASLHCE